MSLPEIPGYELLEEIGSGSCGTVYRALSGGRSCAVKVFSPMAIHRRALAEAMGSLMRLPPHHGVLPVEQVQFDQVPYFMVQPLVGELVRAADGQRRWQSLHLEHLCDGQYADQAWPCIESLAEALECLHRHGLAHGNLRPRNVLLDSNSDSPILLADIAQGWVGGVYHYELTDHAVHLCPEHLADPSGVFDGRGPSWDVYSFGVIAYRLLTGELPRAAALWREQMQTGLMDHEALIAAVRAQPRVEWPSPASSKWEERRRSIIDCALDLNAQARWADMREVVREFEKVEADRALEEAREQIARVRRQLTLGRRGWMTALLVASTALAVCALYAFATLRRAWRAEEAFAQQAQAFQRDVAQQKARLDQANDNRKSAESRWKAAQAGLQHAQSLVDQLLTQLLQMPIGSEMEAAFSKRQLEEALRYCLKALPTLGKEDAVSFDRLRAYANLGQIHLRLHQIEPARAYLEKARDQAEQLMKASAAADVPLLQQWLGRSSLLLAGIHQQRGDRAASLALLKEATHSLALGLEADPQNGLLLRECASAWIEYGQRALQDGNLQEAEAALGRVPELLGRPGAGDQTFLAARALFLRGLAQRDAGQAQEALNTLVEAVTEMGRVMEQSSPRNQEQALLLAEAYTEVAELIGRHFGAKDAREAHQQAISVLLELIRLQPEWAEAKYLLARNYGALALHERDAGAREDAVKKKQDAIEMLNEVLADDPDNQRYAALLARLRGEYAELMADMGKPSAGLPIIKQAVESLAAILAKNSAGLAERRQWEIQLAQMYGVLGHASESLGEKKQARAAFEEAASRWEKLAALNPGDDFIRQGLRWAKERLAKLK